MPCKGTWTFPAGDGQSWSGSKKRAESLHLCSIPIAMVAMWWYAFELTLIKGREKSCEWTSEDELKDTKTLNHGVWKYKEN